MGSIIALFKAPKPPLLFHIGIEQQQPSNAIKTTSYNILTFLPLATLIQFKRLANVYFLVTAVLQFIPAISPLSPVSAIAPLIFVLTVSLIRTGIEQIGKYRYDRQANSSKFLVFTQQQCQQQKQQGSQQQQYRTQTKWIYRRSDQLKVGSIVKIQNNQRFPADLILLSTANADGKVYMQTSSLDGEKNLKIRNVLACTQEMYESMETINKIQENKPFVTIEQPNQQLYSFNGMIEYTKVIAKNNQQKHNKFTQQKISEFIKINQFLYRQAVLRNTDYVIGVIAYVGNFTKSMMNSTGGRDKMSRIQKKVNFYMIFIFIMQFCLVLLCGLLHILLFYCTQNGQIFMTLVLRQQIINYVLQATITACSYFILLNTLIPISLLVSIQIIKFGQGIFIGYDRLMTKYDSKTKTETSARAFRSSINEQLGMVEYVFTDKTGTLTRNEMILKKLIIGNKQYNNQQIYYSSDTDSNIGDMVDHYYNQQLSKQCYNGSIQEVNTKVIKELAKIVQWQPQQEQEQSQMLQSESENILLNQKLCNSLMMIIMSTCHQCILAHQGSTSKDNDKESKNKDKNKDSKNKHSSKGDDNNSKVEYHGSSPDEITLVDSAYRLGYKFIENSYDKIRIAVSNNTTMNGSSNSKISSNTSINHGSMNSNVLQFKVQNMFQFNSDRKRMSVILSHPALPSHKLLVCKGADNVIDQLLRRQYKYKHASKSISKSSNHENTINNANKRSATLSSINSNRNNTKNMQYQFYQNVKSSINQFSKVGLRTLLFGYKFIRNSQYEQMKEKLIEYTDINQESNNDKAQRLKSSSSISTQPYSKQSIINILQANLHLCGATGVEDKLQDQVESVIEDLIKANIKVCMLTGDKMETAENIAKSCRLFKEEWKIIKIGEGSQDVDIFKGYCEAKDYIERKDKYGVLIEGSAIANAISSIYFQQLFQNCAAAVCCRITPKNKAQVVNLAKNELKKLVLAIGDGANDVPMIQAANIGIGLYGNQGMNAVQASDFAIPQFKCLWRLLFVHGRWNYNRIAQLIKYFFYKNLVFTLGQLWYAYLCGFSGTSIYNATYLVLYNTIFTGGPVLVRALLEQDVNYVQVIEQVRMEEREKQKNMIAQQKQSKMSKQGKSLTNKLLQSDHQQNILKLSSMNTTKSILMQQSQAAKNNQRDDSDDRFYEEDQPKLKTVSKIIFDNNMKYLFPLLYAHSQQQLSLTPKIFVLVILQSTVESFAIFLTIYFGIQSQQFWIFSICLYSVIFAIVTIRICYDITYWTWVMVSALLFTSVLPYILFIYVMSLLQWQLSGTFVELFKIPDFYLCIGLAIGVGSFLQATFSVLNKYYFPSVVHFVRKQWKNMHMKELQQQKKQKEIRKQQRRTMIENKYKQIMKSSRTSQQFTKGKFQSKKQKNQANIEIQMKQFQKTKKQLNK